MRYNNRGTRYDDRTLIEKASTLVITKYIPNVNAADIPIGWALYDMEFLGGWIELAADDDGAVTVEKWDDQAGSTQTAMSAVNTLDGGVALEGAFTVSTTEANTYIAAGEKINLLSATFDGSVAAHVTLYFRTVQYVGIGS
jgi:hypothetical protein